MCIVAWMVMCVVEANWVCQPKLCHNPTYNPCIHKPEPRTEGQILRQVGECLRESGVENNEVFLVESLPTPEQLLPLGSITNSFKILVLATVTRVLDGIDWEITTTVPLIPTNPLTICRLPFPGTDAVPVKLRPVVGDSVLLPVNQCIRFVSGGNGVPFTYIFVA